MKKALLSTLSLAVALAFTAPVLTATSASAASAAATTSTTATTAAKPMVKKHKKHRKHVAKKMDKTPMKKKTDKKA